MDLISENESVRSAIGAKKFNDISDPLVFRDPPHYSRMRVGDIAAITPKNIKFSVLVKLIEMTESDIIFQWQVRSI